MRSRGLTDREIDEVPGMNAVSAYHLARSGLAHVPAVAVTRMADCPHLRWPIVLPGHLGIPARRLLRNASVHRISDRVGADPVAAHAVALAANVEDDAALQLAGTGIVARGGLSLWFCQAAVGRFLGALGL